MAGRRLRELFQYRDSKCKMGKSGLAVIKYVTLLW